MYHYSRRKSIPRRVAVPAATIALMLLSGGGYAIASEPTVPVTSTTDTSPLAIAVNNARATLEHAEANVVTAREALKVAQEAYIANAKRTNSDTKDGREVARKNLHNAKSTLEALRKSLALDFKVAMDIAIAKAKANSGINSEDSTTIAKARELVNSAAAALNDAKAKISLAEKASKESTTDATLVSALNNARETFAMAQKKFAAAKDAFESLLPKNDKTNPPINTKELERSVQAAFLSDHPELASAQKAVSDAERVLASFKPKDKPEVKPSVTTGSATFKPEVKPSVTTGSATFKPEVKPSVTTGSATPKPEVTAGSTKP